MADTRVDTEMAEAILEYLAEHPQAMDTLEGIAEWWLLRQQIRVNLTALQRVLRGLTDTGLLDEVNAAGRRLYRLKT